MKDCHKMLMKIENIGKGTHGCKPSNVFIGNPNTKPTSQKVFAVVQTQRISDANRGAEHCYEISQDKYLTIEQAFEQIDIMIEADYPQDWFIVIECWIKI